MMTDFGQVGLRERVAIEFEEAEAQRALVTWLKPLLGQARSRALIIGRFQLRRPTLRHDDAPDKSNHMEERTIDCCR